MQTNLPTTGFFGPLTKKTVKAFQDKHKNQILIPLGLTAPTGSVYSATKRQINILACGGVVPIAESLSLTGNAASPIYIPKASVANLPVVKKLKVSAVETKLRDLRNTNAKNNAKPVGPAIGELKSLFKNLLQR
jgi:peptidoglycan hydrolase-like protein with peptidoglycan-binding domain